MTDSRSPLLVGTLDLLILKTLSLSEMHGYGIAQHIRRLSKDALRVEEGSLYPALHRMEQNGWLRSSWGTTEKNREARFYEITALGKRRLEEERESWSRLTEGVGRVLRYA